MKTNLQHTSIYNIFFDVCLPDENTLTLCKSAILPYRNQSASSHFTVITLHFAQEKEIHLWHSDKKQSETNVNIFLDHQLLNIFNKQTNRLTEKTEDENVFYADLSSKMFCLCHRLNV